MRGVAQTISYEIRFAIIIIILVVYLISISLDFIFLNKLYFSNLLTAPLILNLWLISSLAETNRTPFDFSEGERELVSGFNTEYGAWGFALIFMAEYGRIYFLSAIRVFFFSPRVNLF